MANDGLAVRTNGRSAESFMRTWLCEVGRVRAVDWTNNVDLTSAVFTGERRLMHSRVYVTRTPAFVRYLSEADIIRLV